MSSNEINELKRIFGTRLETLDHILTVGEQHFPEFDKVLQERMAPDMFPLGTQIAFTCNQPRTFAQWCAGQMTDNLDGDVTSKATARSHIRDTQSLLTAINASDSRLDEIKHTALGPDFYCETPARLWVSDFLMPNFYFHISIAYAILRKLGAPLGKPDYMRFLMPHVRQKS